MKSTDPIIERAMCRPQVSQQVLTSRTIPGLSRTIQK